MVTGPNAPASIAFTHAYPIGDAPLDASRQIRCPQAEPLAGPSHSINCSARHAAV